MSMPPISPLNINGKATTYFQLLCDEAQKYLDDIELNFEGYETTVQKYKIVSDTDKEINYELSKEFNAWSEYFSEVANYIQNKYLDAETEAKWLVPGLSQFCPCPGTDVLSSACFSTVSLLPSSCQDLPYYSLMTTEESAVNPKMNC